MAAVFSGWEDIQTSEKFVITTNTPESINLSIQIVRPAGIVPALFRSACYWVLNLTDDQNASYRTSVTTAEGRTGVLSAKSQQEVAYIGLVTMMGFVKEITARNHDAGLKRWKAGLAGQSLSDLLDDSFKREIWDRLLAIRADVYGDARFRKGALTAYLNMYASSTPKPQVVTAVLSQLNLVYENAYLKTVICMHDFITSGSPAMLIPSIIKEARSFKPTYDQAVSIEGARFSMCRLLDNSVHPDLNHSKYPELYAATLIWAKAYKKVQRNYVGSKSITDRAMDANMVKRLMAVQGMRSLPRLSEDDRAWAESVGCVVDDETMERMNDALKTTSRKRPAHEYTSDSESESDEEEAPRKMKRRR